MAVASLQISLARRRGNLAGVLAQAAFLDAPVTGQSGEDVALGSDLRAVALMNLGIVEAWSLASPDAERHLQEGAALARDIGRPYLEVSCLAQLAFASKIHSFATTQRRCYEAIAVADRYGWGAEPIIAPALVTLASTMAWTGDFAEGDRWLQGTARALQTDSGPGIQELVHIVRGELQAARGRHQAAFEEFCAAEQLGSRLAGPHALANQVTSWLLASQARLGQPGEARARLAALDDERANSGEIRNAAAVISLADGDPAAALGVLRPELDGTAPVIGYVTGSGRSPDPGDEDSPAGPGS